MRPSRAASPRLATGGRFLEIGKRDIYADAVLGLHAFRNNIAFFAIDLDQLFKQRPERMGACVRAPCPDSRPGELEPLPVTVHPAADTTAAFRSMQQARHIGKVVIGYAERPRDIRPAAAAAGVAFRADATYWVAGGLGGFGLEIARWMAAAGAGTPRAGRPQRHRARLGRGGDRASIVVVVTSWLSSVTSSSSPEEDEQAAPRCT